MHPFCLLLPLFAAASLTGQTPSGQDPSGQNPSGQKTPRPPIETAPVKSAPAPVQKTDAGMATRAESSKPAASSQKAATTAGRALPLPTTVLHDQSPDGTLWALGTTWKASFDGATCTFVPFFGSTAPHNWPLSLRLASVHSGTTGLALQAHAAQRSGDRILFERGACREQFDLQPTSVEQSWLFAELPTREALRLVLEQTTDLRGEDLGADLAFHCALGTVQYGHAVAIDARGERCALELDCREGHIELVVPATFLATAQLPLLVDPVLTVVPLASTTSYQGQSDLAFDYTTQEFLCVWQRSFSQTDQDLFAQRLGLDQTLVGTPFSLDFTSVSWAKPRVANNGNSDNFLVVAECSNGGVSPFWVGGRIYGNSTGALAQLTLERTGTGGSLSGDCSNPDVGGDPLELGPSYFTVVWEREFSTSDHDIVMRQVTPAGALRASFPTIVDSSFSYESRPSISKSNGYSYANNFASQYWTIAYQRTFNIGDEDIRASQITWDGQFVSGTTNFSVSSSSLDENHPVASSPTDETVGPRRHVVAFERYYPAYETDIVVSIGDGNQAVLHEVDLQLLEGAFAQNWAQLRPAVDCDGYRFAVAYQEQFSGAGNDWDTLVSTIAIDPATSFVTVSETRAVLGGSTIVEWVPAIASCWSGGGGSMQYGIMFENDDLLGNYSVLGAIYNGHSSGPMPSTRATSCGSLSISLTDTPALGRTIVFQQSDSGPFTGFVFGFPTTVPISACPGCVLGVNGSTVMNPFGITMPTHPSFLGVPFACQAWSFYSGTCLGSIALSDTIDFTVL